MSGKVRWLACFLTLTLVLPASLSLVMPQTAQAICLNTVYVNGTTGDDSWDGSAATHTSGSIGPKSTINSGIGVVCDGGTVHVAAGTYNLTGANRIYISHSLNLVGENAYTTIIDGAGLSSWEVIQIEPDPAGTVNISGFMVRHGYTWGGAWVYDNSGIVNFNDCIITDNYASNFEGSDGGGIFIEEGNTVNMNRCTISSSHAGGTPLTSPPPGEVHPTPQGSDEYCYGGAAGGIFVYYSSLTMNDCLLQDNTASASMAAPGGEMGDFCHMDVSGSGGGMVAIESLVTMTRCTVSGNSASGYDDVSGVGGGIVAVDGSLTMTGCTVSGNSASGEYDLSGSGGGLVSIFNQVRIDGSTFDGNTASGPGGGILLIETTAAQINDFTLTNNTSDSYGGGLMQIDGTLTLNRGTISHNQAGYVYGGIGSDPVFISSPPGQQSPRRNTWGFFADPVAGLSQAGGPQTDYWQSLTVNDCTIDSNTASWAVGGIGCDFTLLSMERCTVSNNTAGGLCAGVGTEFFSTSTLTNCTIYGNSITGDEYVEGGGGVCNIADSQMDLLNTTIVNNTTVPAPDSSGGGFLSYEDSITTFKNCIVANNSAVIPGTNNCYTDDNAIITSLGHNIDSLNECGFNAAGDQVNTNPMLGPLQNNSGLTLTCAISTDSPAFDRGDNSGAPATDQRGVVRPQSAYVDIGAFELVPPPPTTTPTWIGPGTHGSSLANGPTQPSFVNLPSIIVSQASVSPSSVGPGAAVTVTATVENKGTANGILPVKLIINGQEEASRSATVESGKTAPLSFTVTRSQPGSYTVYVGGVSAGSFVVEDVFDPNIILYISAAFVLTALAFAVIYIRGRRQYR